jgi:uncharacterized membrane protein
MSSIPLLDAPFAVLFHVATVVPAALIGAWLLARPKGTRLHRALGRVWIGLMAATSLSRAARRRDIAAHRGHVAGMYLGGIVVAGAFTFLPGRIMHDSLAALGGGIASLALAALLCAAFVSAGLLAAGHIQIPGRRRPG